MTDILQKYAAARTLFPNDIQRIEVEEEQVRRTLRLQAYADDPVTQELMALCRKQVVDLRRSLATDRALVDNPEAQRDIWTMIDARMWFIELVGKDFEGELSLIGDSLDAELHR